jgi:integrase
MAGKLTAGGAESHAKRRGRYGDGDGLFLRVLDPGKRVYWVYRFTFHGKERETSLGSFPAISLAQARDKHIDLRKLVKDGIDPVAKRSAKAAPAPSEKPMFGAMADLYVKNHESAWRNIKHRWQWSQTLTTYAAPIWLKPVDQVATADVLACITPLWTRAPETGRRLRGRIEVIIDAARALGHIDADRANPARWKGHLDHLLPKPAKLSRGHHRALAYGDVPEFVKRLREVQAGNTAALALEFLILTATRTSETLGALWDEVDFETATWNIEGKRMKTSDAFSVPLSGRVLDILKTQHETRGKNPHVFPGRPTKPLSTMALAMLLRRMGFDVTVHGYRTSFRTWCSDVAHAEFEIAEMCLSHRIGSAVSRAYNRTTMLERRRPLMQSWCDYVCGANASAKVVSIRA